MKRYETYKNSGVEWIGEIPEGWEVSRIKQLANNEDNSFVDGDWIESPFIEETGIRYLTTGNIGNGIFKRQGNGYISEKTFSELKCKYAYPGDLVFSRLNAPYGRSCILPEDNIEYVLAVDNVILRTNNDKKFICYVSQCPGYGETVGMGARGTTMKRISRTNLGNIQIPFPPLSEQQQISSYLDYKVGQIDSSLAKIVEQIEDLKSYRQSVISEAVTKGLNPNAKMKDSGVEWIGEIPEGWECVPLKRLASIQTGTTPSTSVDEYWSDPMFDWFTPGDFSEGKFILNNSKRKLSLYAKEKNACRIFPEGTVYLVGIGATLGKIGYSEIEASANQQINAIIFNSDCVSKFGAYYLHAIRDYICSRANSSTLPILNQTETGELPFLLPPLSEQQQIASYLDSKTSKIDSSIQALELQKSQLEDYKRSLISEAVTGKVDLRGWKQKCEQ